MKKLDKVKVNKVYDVLDTVLTIACFVAGIITQLKYQDTTQALCWVIVGILTSAVKIEVN